MLLTLVKKDKKDALDLFKEVSFPLLWYLPLNRHPQVLMYMGDKSNKQKLSQDQLALSIGMTE
jgi:hypothetical protein